MASKEKLELADIPVMNLGKFVLERMKEHGDKIALIDSSADDLTYTFNDMVDKTERVAAGLQHIGVQKDDVICIVSPNNNDYIVSFYATILISAVFKPVNPLHTKNELNKMITDCNVKFIITIPALLPKIREAIIGCDSIKLIVFGDADDGCISFKSLLDPSHSRYVERECDPKSDTAALMSSSGTTGFPKSVKITHFAIIANMLQIDNMTEAVELTAVSFMPLFHMYGLILLSTYFNIVGSQIVLMSKFIPDEYMRLIEKYKPRTLQVVPPIMVMFAKYPKVADFDLSSVKTIKCGAAPLSKEIEDMVVDRLKCEHVHQGYGMTEIGCSHLNDDKAYKYKAVGKLVPLADMKIVDVDSGKILGKNEEGEIYVKGPQVANGYLNLPKESSEVFLDDGWVRTGDIGKEDEDGFLYIVDRLKELIKYKGFQVAPATLEDILLNHESVADVAVVGVPDESAGELPKAYVVKKPGTEVTEEILVEFVAGLVAPHLKLRGGVEFITEIPRTSSGKILRKPLRERVQSGKQ